MSVLFTSNDCALISHEKFINQIYSNYVELRDEDKERCYYQIATDLFDLNVPYRRDTVIDGTTRNRHRKAVDKKISKQIESNQEEYDLVTYPLNFSFNKSYSNYRIKIYFFRIRLKKLG